MCKINKTVHQMVLNATRKHRTGKGTWERVVREGVPHKVSFEQKEVWESWEKTVQSEGTAGAKVLRQESAWGLEECGGTSASRVQGARVKVAGEGGEERAEGQARSGRHGMTLASRLRELESYLRILYRA